MTDTQSGYTEHRVRRDHGSLYVRDFLGNAPAFVVLHGFPDNSHIYDDLIPLLVAAGRRIVAIDFWALARPINLPTLATVLNSS